MKYLLSDEQTLLRDQVRALLQEKAAPDKLRKLIVADAHWDEDLWRAVADLGLLGASIPEEYGGVGLGALDLGVIAEEMGRATAPIPFFSSICMAAEAILLAGSEAQKKEWLPKLASGEVVGTFAYFEGAGEPSESGLRVKFVGGKLDGVKHPVADARVADICIVATQGGDLSIVKLDQNAVIIEDVKSFDELRHHARVTFKGAAAELLDGPDAPGALSRLWDRMAVYEAFEQIGGADSSLYMARDYAMQRFIFGRPLASYQAIKHKLADILAMVELARANALYAAGAIDDHLPDLPAAAATARIGATQAYEVAARENLQVHGGIGFTWEANCHFHYRRARVLALNLGSAAVWSDRLIDALASKNAPAAA